VTPLSWAFAGVVLARNALYDAGVLATHHAGVPVVSVGNITVGGTGKTPLVASLVARLREMGRSPAVVLRGYGGDETVLHRVLNPGVVVVADRDRVRGAREAARRGADVVVLDDGFQHRRLARDLDVVVVSVEQWLENHRMLPAGPGREARGALRRAQMIVLTSKRASPAERDRVRTAVVRAAPGTCVVGAALVPAALVAVGRTGPEHALARLAPASLDLGVLRGASVLAAAGIGDPYSFFAQLQALGARVTRRTFRDHHPFTDADAASLVAEGANHNYVVVTGKDAVKLGPLWPAKGPPLWYVSQSVAWTDPTGAVGAALRAIPSRTATA